MILACRCGNADPWKWEDVTDAQTGTAYARCDVCGAHALASPAGFVDWKFGLMLGTPGAVGSAWTQKVSASLLADLSRLSTRT